MLRARDLVCASISALIRAIAVTWNRKADQSRADGHADDGLLLRIGKGGRPTTTSQQCRTDGEHEPTNGAFQCHCCQDTVRPDSCPAARARKVPPRAGRGDAQPLGGGIRTRILLDVAT